MIITHELRSSSIIHICTRGAPGFDSYLCVRREERDRVRALLLVFVDTRYIGRGHIIRMTRNVGHTCVCVCVVR